MIRHIPTVCYLEVPRELMHRRAEFERDRCRVMAVASTFFGTLDEQQQWTDNGEPRDKWWKGELDRVLLVWEAQGWDSRLALRFDWFEDQRLPAGTQAAFSNFLADQLAGVLRANGGTLDLLFADNEQDVPSAQLDRAFGRLRDVAVTWGNWNHARGRSWWGPFRRPPLKSGIPQAYQAVDEPQLAELCATIREQGPSCICWGPCLNRYPDWSIVDEATSDRFTERMILYAMARGCTRFGIHLPQIKDPMKAWDLPRWNRHIDHVDAVIKMGDAMMGRAG